MKLADIEEFAKHKKKEHRMKIDKIRESARQQNQEKQDRKCNKVLLEKYHYDSKYCER
ncbi:MAG: hypothetical protein J0665_08855 [Deltaproteobacteria bacterium]|nr:hypothetical protein [Deltaproteobacteria bacterium]